MVRMPEPRAFYLTTPIYYVNDAPHIGHAYTTVAGDMVTRWHRQRQEPVWFLTGTDEHGQKVLRTAEANGASPQDWADRLVEGSWKPVLDTIDAANDDFIRTTQERHTTRVQTFIQDLHDRGEIFAGSYEGPYCVGCEEYKLPGDLVPGTGEHEGQLVCAIHGRPVEMLSEQNYFFRMSAYTQALLDHYEANPTFVQPASARNEVIAFVKQGLQDLSISRSTFDWGVPIPWDTSHVLYVWFDALLNYATAIGYGADDPGEKARFASTWPADVHLVGKDILRFHAVIWPAMLMAAGLELPRQVFAHGWLLVGGEKMSKSKLTGIAPSQIIDHFGSDAFRYYFLRAIPFGTGRLVLLGGPRRAVQRRARQRLRQPRLARRGDDRQVLRRRPARGRAARSGRDRPGRRRRAGRRRRRGRRGPARAARGDRRGLDPRRGDQRLPHRAGALAGRQGPGRAGRRRRPPAGWPPRDDPRHGRRGAARARGAAAPGDAAGRCRAVGLARRGAVPRAARRAAGRDRGDVRRSARRHPGHQGRRAVPAAGGPRGHRGVSRRPRDRSWPPAPAPLPVAVVDNHTHLDTAAELADGEAPPTVAEQIARAAAVGVPRMVQIGCDLPAARWTDRVVREHPALLGGVAIHPNEATLFAGARDVGPDGLTPAPRAEHAVGLDAAIAEIADLARDNDRIRVIGETGLDHFRSGDDGRAAQVASFRAHLALAKELDLALQIHDRDAHAAVLGVLARDGAPSRTVFHCFSGDAAMARFCAAQGWYLSFAGTVTFAGSAGLREALASVPLGQVLVETDAPYLTPHPYRGRPNAPYLVPHTMRTIAEVHGVPLEHACEVVAATSEAVYGPW